MSAERPRVAVCCNCCQPIVKPYGGTFAGTWTHASGDGPECRDRWGYPWPDAVATPRRPPGTPTGPVVQR